MRTLLLCLAFSLLGAAGCSSRCEDLHAEAIEGAYQLRTGLDDDVSLEGLVLTAASLDASADRVVLTYTTAQGAQLRATYRVKKKSKVD